MNKSMKSSFSLFLALGVTFLLAACGGGDDAPSTPARAPAEALTPDRSITITANDQMKFGTERIEASPGEVLELTLDNIGTMPKFSMGHNVVILQVGTDPQKYVEAAANHAAADYLPPQWKGSVVAATALTGGGEKATVVFQVPARPGDYPFVCSFPGHYQVGMQGLLVVR